MKTFREAWSEASGRERFGLAILPVALFVMIFVQPIALVAAWLTEPPTTLTDWVILSMMSVMALGGTVYSILIMFMVVRDDGTEDADAE